jgi:hypothetical protein
MPFAVAEWPMKTDLETFINRENIKNFKKRLEAPTDDALRTTLRRLLAEEEAKAEQLAKRVEDDNKATRSP